MNWANLINWANGLNWANLVFHERAPVEHPANQVTWSYRRKSNKPIQNTEFLEYWEDLIDFQNLSDWEILVKSLWI